jgi:hypothetical protein
VVPLSLLLVVSLSPLSVVPFVNLSIRVVRELQLRVFFDSHRSDASGSRAINHMQVKMSITPHAILILACEMRASSERGKIEEYGCNFA